MELGAKFAPSFDEFHGTRQLGENTYKLGASAGAGFRYGLLGPVAAQMELLYATRGTDVTLDGMGAGSFYFTYLEIPVLLNVTWRVPGLAEGGQRSPLSIHLAAGPGVSYLLSAVRDDFSGTFELSRSTVRDWDVSAIAGLGFTWDVTPHWAASFEVRYDMGFIDTFPNVADDRETRNRAILFTLGVGYTVNDGDGDGVIGSRDQCRTQSEDWNGLEDHDGCPDADDDRDGFRGKAEACPEEAEDVNGYQDEDGCPDADDDKDKDGLFGKDDACPDQAFTYNKRLTHNRRGCPPKLDRVWVERGEVMVTPPLEFGFAEDTLTPEHRQTLDQVAVLLRDYYPDMQLIVEGHADSKLVAQDRPVHNQKRSQNRANAVKYYLVEIDDIDEGRLRVEARGNDNPRAIEAADGVQRSNRRVELIILANPEPE